MNARMAATEIAMPTLPSRSTCSGMARLTKRVSESDDRRRYFGAIRIAPSRRITSPFIIGLTTISRTSDANSDGRPSRGGNGTILPSASCTSGVRLAIIGVSKMPGAIVMTRMPERASSRASGSVMPTTPAFDALYAAWPIWPSNAATDAVLTITPRSPPALGELLVIADAASRIMLNVPTRLMLTARAKLASPCRPSLPTTRSPCTMPAQLTSACTPPNASSAACTQALPLASSVTSVWTKRAASPSAFVSALPASSFRSATTTRAPPSTAIRAVAAPSPDAPPVTMNTLPASSIPCSSLCARARLGLDHRQRGGDQPRDVGNVGRHDHAVRRLREIAELRDVFLGDLEVHRADAAGLGDRLGDLPDRLRVRLGDREDRRRLSLRGVDLRLLRAFRLRDRRLASALRDVDLLLALAFRRRDHRPLLALGSDLRLHRAQDLGRRRQVLDLVAQHLDAPVRRRRVERADDGRVDRVALLERAIELHAADDAAQRRLRELGDGEHVIGRAVRREPRIGHLEVENAVDGELRVVLRDADLRRHVERRLAQIVAVRDAIEKRHDEIEAGREHAVEAAEPLDDPRMLLRHDADRLHDPDQDDDEDDERDDRKARWHAVSPETCGYVVGRFALMIRRSWLLAAEHERRSARVDNVHGVAARRRRRREHAVPMGAAINDARRAVGAPCLDMNAAADVEAGLRQWLSALAPPMVRERGPDHGQHAGGEQLHRPRDARDRHGAPDRARDADRQQIEGSGDELGADQDRGENPPQPIVGHVPSYHSRNGR